MMNCYLFNRQEYDVREERRRELEFLEKVWQFDLSIFFSGLIYEFFIILRE